MDTSSHSKCFIYGLLLDDIIFYVGQSSVGKDEPEGYLRWGPYGTTRKMSREIIHARRDNRKLSWVVLEECSKDELDTLEIFWIASLRAAGASLTNMTDGGQGTRNHDRAPWTEEAKGKQKIRMKQVMNLPGVSEKLVLANARTKDTRAAKVSAAWTDKRREDQRKRNFEMWAAGMITVPRRPRILRKCDWCAKEIELIEGSKRALQPNIYCCNLHAVQARVQARVPKK